MQSKIVDARAEEAGERISGRFHDRLAFHVERSVQQDGNARNRIKLLEQSIKPFALELAHAAHLNMLRARARVRALWGLSGWRGNERIGIACPQVRIKADRLAH
jgi:anti-sigma-K factor RskA